MEGYMTDSEIYRQGKIIYLEDVIAFREHEVQAKHCNTRTALMDLGRAKGKLAWVKQKSEADCQIDYENQVRRYNGIQS